MQKEKADRVRQEREELPDITEELRKKFRQHREKFEAAREPLLEGLASKYDLELFREAQARACEQLVNITFYIHLNHSISECNNLKSCDQTN